MSDAEHFERRLDELEQRVSELEASRSELPGNSRLHPPKPQIARDAASAEASQGRTDRPGPPLPSIEDLAARQGVEPVTSFDDLVADFWPEDETADEFNAAVDRWRHGEAAGNTD